MELSIFRTCCVYQIEVSYRLTGNEHISSNQAAKFYVNANMPDTYIHICSEDAGQIIIF